MPKHTDDPAAREAARELLDISVDADSAAVAVDIFPYVEFEIAAKTIDGDPVTLRRVILISNWQVVAK